MLGLFVIPHSKEADVKPRTLLNFALLVLVGLSMSAPAASQTESYIHWQAMLRGETANTWALAEYAILKPVVAPSPVANDTFVKFSVVAVTPNLPDGTQLGVFLGPPTDLKDPYGKLVGVINIKGGTGAMIRFSAKVPAVRLGTPIAVVDMNPVPGTHQTVLQGKF